MNALTPNVMLIIKFHFLRKDHDLNGLTSTFCCSLVSLAATPIPDEEVTGLPGSFAFFLLFVQDEQYQTNRGSLTFSLARLGLWHSW